MKKIKVVHLISTDVFSGAENVACQIINCFKDNPDYEEMIYVSAIGKNLNSLLERNVKYYELKKFNYLEIRYAIKILKPDVIHAHDIKASVYASLIAGRNIKVVSHIHANHENMRKIGLKTCIFDLCKNRISKMFWVSKSALDNYVFRKHIINKSCVLYNVIDPAEISYKILSDKKEYGEYDIIYLGRLTYQKNPERLMNILLKICNKNENVSVAIVGQGEYSSYVQDFIKNNHLEKNIKYFGFMTNPYKLLSCSKLMLMSSRYEGTPMCVLEAMSLGIPVISTPTDGLEDIVENDFNGFLSNNDDNIVCKALEYIADSCRYKCIKENVKKKFNEINNITNYVKQIDDSYRR